MKTKRTILIAILSIAIFGTSQAQGVSSGFKGGLNASTLYVDDVENTKIRPGFNAGVFVNTPASDHVGLQLEFLFSTAGNRTEYDNILGTGQIDFNLNYLQVPLLATVTVGKILDLHLGVHGAYLIGANTSSDGDFGSGYSELNRGHFNEFDYGLTGGVGINIEALQIGARYNHGLKDVARSAEARSFLGSSKNAVAQVYVAVGF